MGNFLDHFGRHVGKYVVGTLASIIAGSLIYNFNPLSRRTLNPAGKTMEYILPDDFSSMINVSSAGSEGDLMITYENRNGEIMTREYNRGGLWETTIEWKLPNERDGE